jgi:hypothetical protein
MFEKRDILKAIWKELRTVFPHLEFIFSGESSDSHVFYIDVFNKSNTYRVCEIVLHHGIVNAYDLRDGGHCFIDLANPDFWDQLCARVQDLSQK